MTTDKKISSEVMLRVGMLVNIPAVMSSLGRAPERLLRESGFQVSDFTDPDQLVSFSKASRLLERCGIEGRCDHIGLLIGQRFDPSHLGIPGFLMKSASSVEIGLYSLVENFDLNDGGAVLSIKIGTDRTTLSYSAPLDDVFGKPQIYDLAAAAMCKAVQALCGEDWRPRQVNIMRRKPRDLAVYERCFRLRPYFDATEVSVAFDNRWLSSEPPNRDPLLFTHLRKEAVRAQSLRGRELVDILPGMLRKGLLAESYAAACIARDLGIHERTLHRRLKVAGTNFRKLLDEARESVSKELLKKSGMPVYEVADTLGYTDSSSFIRAFRRWTGHSPSLWRDQNVNDVVLS